VNGTLKDVVLTELTIAIPASSANFFAVSCHIGTCVARFSSVVAINSDRNIRMDYHNVIALCITLDIGVIEAG